MKRNRLGILILTVLTLLFYSCSSDNSTNPDPPTAPTVATSDVSDITQMTAACGGTVSADGGDNVTARGVCWSTSTGPTTADDKTTNGAGTGNFTSSLTGLTAGTPYYIRAYATNSAGTGYGNEVTFTTVALQVPVVSTAEVTAITQTMAACGGAVSSDGGASVAARGVCWSTALLPTVDNDTTINGAGTGSFTSTLTGLSAGTLYHIRAYATNSVGTGYGEPDSFTTAASETVTDIDGHVYQTVTIGTQVWMAENLKVIHYRNGDPIPDVTDGMAWEALVTGALCRYNNSDDTAAIYGLLYNWYAVNDIRNIAPAGWHVPTRSDWLALLSYLGEDAGGKLKDVGTTYWLSPNTGATNESGFGAIPGGLRGYQGVFSAIQQEAYFWTSTEYNSSRAYIFSLSYGDAYLWERNLNKYAGHSIRCIKD